jgi:hypothetical protein
MVMLTCWILWKQRNMRVFGNLRQIKAGAFPCAHHLGAAMEESWEQLE